MCLLERVLAWDEASIRCATGAHRDPDCPLRREGRLSAVCTVEMGLQAMALHGALVGDGPQPQGFVATLGGIEVAGGFADEAAAPLIVRAWLLARERLGCAYRFEVGPPDGPALSSGRATIMTPDAAA